MCCIELLCLDVHSKSKVSLSGEMPKNDYDDDVMVLVRYLFFFNREKEFNSTIIIIYYYYYGDV